MEKDIVLELGETLISEKIGIGYSNETVDGTTKENRDRKCPKSWPVCVGRMILAIPSVMEKFSRWCFYFSMVAFTMVFLLNPFLWTQFSRFFGKDARVQDYELEVFELDVPIRKAEFSIPNRQTETECSQVLVQHVFGWSYGKPYVGLYEPPSCTFTHVYFNVSTTSKGRQFDRLWHLFLDDVEIWRSSTAEPTESGINFHDAKDMTLYTNLLKQPGKIIMDLGNLLDDKYTGSFNVTITATYYTPQPSYLGAPNPPSQIFPVSKRLSSKDQPSHFHLPTDRAISTISFSPDHNAAITLPQTTSHLILSLSASGNAEEEFWYQNVPTDLTKTFPDMTLPGHTAHREIQILLNGNLIAAVNPFVNIFTGGINPGLWRPVVSIGTYDVGEVDLDITAFLPRILETRNSGAPAEVEIKVVGFDNGKEPSISTDWLVSGRLLVWAHDDASMVLHSGEMLATVHMSDLITTHQLGPSNSTLDVNVLSKRIISQSTTLTWGSRTRAPLTQRYDYSTSSWLTSVNNLTEGGYNQFTTHAVNSAIANTISRSSGCQVKYETILYELLGVASNYTFDKPSKGDFGIGASVSHLHCFSGWNTPSVASWFLYNSPTFFSCSPPPPTGPTAPTIQRRTNGTAHYFAPASAGNKPATMSAHGAAKTTLQRGVKVHSEAVGEYEREVATRNLTVVEDSEVVDGVWGKWRGFGPRFDTGLQPVQGPLGREEVVGMGRGGRAEAVRKRLGIGKIEVEGE